MNLLAHRTGRASLALALLVTSSLSFAQPGPPPGPRDDRGGPARHVAPAPHGAKHPGAAPQARPGTPHHRAPGRMEAPGHRPGHPDAHAARGAGPDRNWQRGSRMPAQFRTQHYVVNDWRGHRLSAPPRGHQWVQNGSDYLLVAIATGVIAQIVWNH